MLVKLRVGLTCGGSGSTCLHERLAGRHPFVLQLSAALHVVGEDKTFRSRLFASLEQLEGLRPGGAQLWRSWPIGAICVRAVGPVRPAALALGASTGEALAVQVEVAVHVHRRPP